MSSRHCARVPNASAKDGGSRVIRAVRDLGLVRRQPPAGTKTAFGVGRVQERRARCPLARAPPERRVVIGGGSVCLLGHHPASARGFVVAAAPSKAARGRRARRSCTRPTPPTFLFRATLFHRRPGRAVVAAARQGRSSRRRRRRRPRGTDSRPSHSRHVRDARVRAQGTPPQTRARLRPRAERSRSVSGAFRFNRNLALHAPGVSVLCATFPAARRWRPPDGARIPKRSRRRTRLSFHARCAAHQPTPALVNVPRSAFRRRVVSGSTNRFSTGWLHGDVVVGVVVPRRLHAPLRARVHADIDVVREPKPRCGRRGL